MKPIVTTGLTLLLALMFTLDAAAQKQATFSVHPSLPRKDISPYVYGTNELYNKATAQRLGGNRMTGYNWENNASNAGIDWLHNSDDYLPWHFGVADTNYEKPAAAIVHYHNQSLASGTYSLITLPMAGYVAKDKNGPVQAGQAAPSSRWAYVRNHKNGPFTLSPNKLDDTVYVDEELNFLINKFGPASSATGIKGYSLDNEPCLWSSTHPRLWGSTGVTVQQLMNRSYDLASLVKSMDSTAEVFGPALYGFNAYLNLQSASDWDSIKLTGSYNYFIEYYLSKMHEKELQSGKRLLDVLDVHWYPETNQTYNARPGSNLNDRNTVAARLEMTRSLWDSTYTENTWIGTWYSGILPLIPKLNQIINNKYPGTKLALSEYSYMGTDHISGAIAQADALGIFGRENLYLATYWGSMENYIKAGFDLYRNYDGAGGSFGNKGVNASTDDNRNTSVYAAYNGSDESRLHVIAINKNQDSSETVTINVDGSHIYHSAMVWLLDKRNAIIRKAKNIRVISNNSFQYELPPLTIAHLVLTEEDLSVYPFIDSLTVSSTMGYSDGNAVLQVSATVLDADHNIDSMYINLAGIGGGARTNMVRSGDHYSISFTIPANTPPGIKTITIRAIDSNGHTAEESFPFQVIRKKQPFVIWDGDTKGGGEGFTYYDPSDSNGPSLTISESASGGNKQAKSLFMHMGHDHYKWNTFAWRFDPDPSGARNISDYGFIEFYIKSTAPSNADIDISLRDGSAGMNMSNTIHLKAGGYISSFSPQYYTRVRIPVSVFTDGTSFDVTKCWQINFLTNTAEEPFDVWLDDITAMPYINTAVQPVFTNVTMTPSGGYADNSTLVTITAETADPDNNIKTVSVDLSALNLPNNKKLILSNGKYTCSFKVPATVANGKKKLRLTVADANYNITDSVLVYDVFAKGSTEMIWDGDNLATGTFWRHDEVTTTYAIDSIGGHQAPKCMKLHFQHTQQDGWSSIVLDWNENTGNTRRIDMSGKRFLNFWLKTGPVQTDFDLIVQIKDQNASSSNAVWIKQKGYVSGFTNGSYQFVSIPIADLMDGATMDLTKVTRIGFISVHSLNGTDVWVDDIYTSGSTVADVRMHATPAACAQNGTITVDSIYADRAPYSYYINKKANPAGLHNKTFSKLLPGMYEITVKGDSGFIYIGQVVVEGAGGLKITGIPDTAGNIDITVTSGSGQYLYTWSNGAHTEDLANMVSGTYKLTIADSLTGCILKRSYIVNNPGLSLSLYPNPATTQINVNFSSAEPLQGFMTISILDYFGNTVSSRTYSSNNGTDQFIFANPNPGLYYLVVQMNGKLFNRSFMIN